MITELFVATMIVVGITGFSVAHDVPKEEVKAQEVVVTPTPSPTPFVEPSDIEGYIRYKFGPDADNALLVLKGNGPGSCAENRNLDPKQDNDNRTWGGVGKDVGYWQINNVYHPNVTEWCARDVKCSTDVAYKLFTARGNFSAWTCGKFYGI